MNNLTGLKFYINEDLNLVVDDFRGKTVKHKVISLDTFCKILKRTVKMRDIKTGVLPDRCISFRENDSGEKFVVMELGKECVDITYESTKYENFPVPRILFGFRINKEGRIDEVQVTVADTGTLRDDTVLYRYPFSNVSGFNMCIGSNTMPKIKQMRQLNGIPYYILSMPDNNDRYSPQRTKLNMEYRTMLEYLKDKDAGFYYEQVLIKNGKTLKDFIYQ